MNMNQLPSDIAALLGTVPMSAAAGAGTYTTAWVDVSKFESLLATVVVGTMVATSTVDAKLQQATSSGGAGAKDITSKAVSQFVAATDGTTQKLINLRVEKLDIENTFKFVRLIITVATAASGVYGSLWGFNARYGPASDFDASTVAQIVS